ncbi:MAG: hypothetical protein FJ207_12825 [Gemmatimonadetes bacterium]|nr:hypothetical protein [Gemmatimonadota bacterium]
MEQLIFFALIIVFSIIESAARAKKKKGGGPLPELPPEWEEPPPPRAERPAQSRPQPKPTEIPSYDTDPSFDGGPTFDERPSFDDAKAREATEKARARSSESMIPAEIWDEITGMAREPARQEPSYTPPPRPKPRPMPAPGPKRAPSPQRPTPRSEPRRSPQPRPKPVTPASKRVAFPTPAPAMEGMAAHTIHASHAGYGTDPSARAPSAQDSLDPLARVLGADASAVRGQLRSHGAHALRQAVILHEVLGPPAADRPDRF